MFFIQIIFIKVESISFKSKRRNNQDGNVYDPVATMQIRIN